MIIRARIARRPEKKINTLDIIILRTNSISPESNFSLRFLLASLTISSLSPSSFLTFSLAFALSLSLSLVLCNTLQVPRLSACICRAIMFLWPTRAEKTSEKNCIIIDTTANRRRNSEKFTFRTKRKAERKNTRERERERERAAVHDM